MVIQGDWQRSLGMPVTMGQNLFEIAELSSLVAEVHLSAEDLGQIRVGDKVSVRADSSGTERFSGSISRIEPRASVSDEGVFFIADVMIQDAEQRLRPGMKASAVVDAGWKRIGSILFSRPYRWLSNQWIW
jgi:multidrug efflux pump subunit AcrA (membrane-fusion protein)